MKIISSFRQLERNMKITFALMAIIAVVSLAYGLTNSSHRSSASPTAAGAAQMRQVVSEISKFMLLPANETPTVATVSNPDALRSQPFFAHAMAGDMVLIYSTTHKAILWRPSTHMIVEVSALDPSAPTTQPK